MNQTFHFVKVASGEPFPFEDGSYIVCKSESIELGSYHMPLFKKSVRGFNLFVLRPLPASPDVEGFAKLLDKIANIAVDAFKPSDDACNEIFGIATEEAKYIRAHFTRSQPSPIQVTRENMSVIVTRQAAEDWILQWCENKPGDYVYDVKEAALAMYDYIQSSQAQPGKEADRNPDKKDAVNAVLLIQREIERCCFLDKINVKTMERLLDFVMNQQKNLQK